MNNIDQMELPVPWAFHPADVNQDGSVDLLNFPLLEYDIVYGLYGYYATDLNGDGNIDIMDFPIFDANARNGSGALHP